MVAWIKRFETWSKPSLMALCLGIVAMVGFLDYLTGYETFFFVFYLFAVFLAVWHVSGSFGGIISAFDDHPLVREGLVNLINQEADLQICGEAGSEPQALELIRTFQPHVAIVDISLENGSGIELTALYRPSSPGNWLGN